MGGIAASGSGGPAAAPLGALAGSVLGLLSYGGYGLEKELTNMDRMGAVGLSPTPTALVSIGNKALSKTAHDAIAEDYYFNALPKIAKAVKGKYFSSQVDDLAGAGMDRLTDVLYGPKVHDFPDQSTMDTYLRKAVGSAMEDSATKNIQTAGSALDEVAEMADATTTGSPATLGQADNSRAKLEGLFDDLTSNMRPRDKVVLERKINASAPVKGGRGYHPDSIRTIAKETGLGRDSSKIGGNVEDVFTRAQAELTSRRQQAQTLAERKGIDISAAASELEPPDYSTMIKAYRKDLPKIYKSDKLNKALEAIPLEQQAPIKDYLRGLTPKDLRRKYGESGAVGNLYETFQQIERLLKSS